MGYFSNGTEFMDWEAENCTRCKHRGDENHGCPIIGAHMAFGTAKKNAIRELLEMFIPQNDNGFCGECTMFLDEGDVCDGSPMFGEPEAQ